MRPMAWLSLAHGGVVWGTVGCVVLLGVVLAVGAQAGSAECLSRVLCYGCAVIHTVSLICYSK